MGVAAGRHRRRLEPNGSVTTGRDQPPMPKTKLGSSCGYAFCESVVMSALGLGTQLSTSAPETSSPEHTAFRSTESATALGAPLVANPGRAALYLRWPNVRRSWVDPAVKATVKPIAAPLGAAKLGCVRNGTCSPAIRPERQGRQRESRNEIREAATATRVHHKRHNNNTMKPGRSCGKSPSRRLELHLWPGRPSRLLPRRLLPQHLLRRTPRRHPPLRRHPLPPPPHLPPPRRRRASRPETRRPLARHRAFRG